MLQDDYADRMREVGTRRCPGWNNPVQGGGLEERGVCTPEASAPSISTFVHSCVKSQSGPVCWARGLLGRVEAQPEGAIDF